MKIIRVVHADSKEELDRVKEVFSIRTFDIEEFISEQVSRWRTRTHKKEPAWTDYVKVLPAVMLASSVMSMLVTPTDETELYIKDVCLKLFDTIKNAAEDSEVLALDTARQKYPRTQNLSVGTFALHPFDSERLTRLEHYHTNLAAEKDDELVVLLGKMGAKTLRIVEADATRKSGSGEVGVEEVITGISGQANVSVSQRLAIGKELLVNFEGHDIEVDPHLLDTSLWFSTDSKLCSILASRLFEPNKITSYTLKNTYTETFDFDFELAAKYAVVKTDLKAEYSSLSKKERFFHVEFSG